MPPTATDEYDLFQRLSTVDRGELERVWTSINSELDQIARTEHDLRERRAEAERMLGVVSSIASFLDIKLPNLPANSLPTRVAEGPANGDNRSAGTAREAARQLITSSDRAYWDADSLEAALRDAGVTTSRSNVRVILQTLLREGLLERVSHGRYEKIDT